VSRPCTRVRGLTHLGGTAALGRGGRPPATARGDKAAGAWRCLVAPGAARDVSGRERDTQAAGERVGGGEGGAATAGPLDAGEDEVAADQDAWARAVLALRPNPRWLAQGIAIGGGPRQSVIDAGPLIQLTFSRTVWRLYGGSKGLMMWYYL
jgi:hypothetical protein